MPLLARDELQTLTDPRSGPTVSLYLPTHRAAPEKRQNPAQLKNLVRDAEAKLAEQGLRALHLHALMAPAHALIENPSAWEHPGDGMAVFLAPDFYREYHLPLPFKQLAVVGDRFHVKPLLPAFLDQDSFFVLAVSQHDVRLLYSTPLTVAEVDLGETPRNLAEALRYDNPQNQVMFHASRRIGNSGGRGGAMWHGHANVASDLDRELALFFRQVDEGVRRVIGEQTAPLILAGVEYERAAYRRANAYPHLVEEGVDGNPELLTRRELHERARPIADRAYEQRMEAERARFQTLAATSQQASGHTKVIVPAAHEGRIERLWVSRTANAWGRFDAATGEVQMCAQPERGCDDLLDLATVETLVRNGQVYVVDQERVPQNGPAAAIFRY